MKTFLTVLKWLVVIGLLVILIIAVGLHFVNFSTSPEEIEIQFSNVGYSPSFKTVSTPNREIFYVTVGDSNKPAVLFVHGSPGSWDNFLGLMTNKELLDDFYLISADRPGFGQSGEGNPERSLVNQASDLASVLEKERKSAILVGHSYGGPVVVRMGIDFPQLTDGLIIVAGSVDPELEKTKWYQVPVDYSILSWILPRFLYSTNEEILALKNELEEMEHSWSTIIQPVSVIQGGQDVLVPKENADYAEKMLVNVSNLSLVEMPEMNHFIPFHTPELIAQEIYTIQGFLSDSTSINE